MNKKLLLVVPILALLCFSTVGITFAEGVFTVNDGQFVCYVSAPKEAKTEEEFSVTFLIKPWATIAVSSVFVEIYGNIGDGGEWTTWNYTWENMDMHVDAEYRAEEEFSVHSDFSTIGRVGEVYGRVTAVYDFNGQRFISYSEFEVTKIYSKTYQELTQDYNSLNQTYQDLQNDYNSLKSSPNANIYQYLTIILIITTLIFVATTVYFARRKATSFSPPPP